MKPLLYLKKLRESWERFRDRYPVISLGLAVIVAVATATLASWVFFPSISLSGATMMLRAVGGFLPEMELFSLWYVIPSMVLVTAVSYGIKKQIDKDRAESRAIDAQYEEARAQREEADARYERARVQSREAHAQYEEARAQREEADARYERARVQSREAHAQYEEAHAQYEEAHAQYEEVRAQCEKDRAESKRSMDEFMKIAMEIEEGYKKIREELEYRERHFPELLAIVRQEAFAKENKLNTSFEELLKTGYVTAEEENELKDYRCPISLEVTRQPIKAPDGKFYERLYLIDAYARGMHHCPTSPDKLLTDPDEMKIDEDQRKRIKDFLSRLQVSVAERQAESVSAVREANDVGLGSSVVIPGTLFGPSSSASSDASVGRSHALRP